MELNDIAVVSMLAIDYDNEYQITAEIRENEKNKLNKSIIYKSKGETLDIAFENMSLTLNKVLYLVDVNAIVITDNIIEKKLPNTIDYITRESNIGSNFSLVVCNDDIDKVLEIIKKKNEIAGSYLKDTITNKFNNTIKSKYTNFLINYLSDFSDNILPFCEISDEEIKMDKGVIFNKEKIVYLNNDEVVVYNLLKNINKYSIFKVKYDNNNVIYRVKSVDTKIGFNDNKINIKVNLVGNLNEMDGLVLSEKLINEMEKLINDEASKKIDNLLTIFINNDIDVLGFKKVIYNKTKNKLDSIYDIKYEIDANANIVREEILFNTIEGKNEIQ